MRCYIFLFVYAVFRPSLCRALSKVFCHWLVENNHPFFCASLPVIPLTWEFHFLIICIKLVVKLCCLACQFSVFGFFCSNQLASYSWVIVCQWWIRWLHDVLGCWVSTAFTVVKQEISGGSRERVWGIRNPLPPRDLMLVWDWNSYMIEWQDRISLFNWLIF